MTDAVRRWLATEIKQLPSVRAVGLGKNDDIVVRTWVGLRVNVYFLHHVPNARALKRTLQDNRRAYNSTMYILSPNLVPADGEQFTPPDWLDGLHMLNHECLYIYDDEAPAINAVHFAYLADGVTREAWHGPPVEFKKLRGLSQSVTVRAMKGNWLVADFGSQPFWKNMDYRNTRKGGRYKERKRYARRFVWGQYDAGSNPGGPTMVETHASKLTQCYVQLGVEPNASKDEVKAAFRKLAREVHPDTTDLPADEAAMRFRELTDAYEFIKTTQRW